MRISFFAICLFLFAACEPRTGEDENRPESFGKICDTTASKCISPYGCIQLDEEDAGVGQCNLACSEDGDCPRWQATGDCSGQKVSSCRPNGVCDTLPCK